MVVLRSRRAPVLRGRCGEPPAGPGPAPVGLGARRPGQLIRELLGRDDAPAERRPLLARGVLAPEGGAGRASRGLLAAGDLGHRRHAPAERRALLAGDMLLALALTVLAVGLRLDPRRRVGTRLVRGARGLIAGDVRLREASVARVRRVVRARARGGSRRACRPVVATGARRRSDSERGGGKREERGGGGGGDRASDGHGCVLLEGVTGGGGLRRTYAWAGRTLGAISRSISPL